jgi:release factor glutamine methyltransferase
LTKLILLRLKDAIRFIIDSTENIYGPAESESIAFIILEFIGFPRKKLILIADDMLDGSQEEFIRKAVKELKNSKPVQYILGETEFYGLRFRLDENVLIPRQETEELVSRIIRENKIPNPVVLDLGTGSGCIAVSIARNIPGAKVFATDISEKALRIAESNALLNGVTIKAITDDMLNTQLDNNLKFDIIVSNPPYVRDIEKQYMHANVLNFEPANALFVRDENPLEFYKAISEIAIQKLNTGGILYVEINENFGIEVADLFRNTGLKEVEIITDIYEKDRFVKAKR